jgi:hypothetical protein
MKQVRVLSALLLVALIWGCSSESEFREVYVNDLYWIDLPSYLDSTAEFNSDASLQYVNKEKAVYIMVIDQPKAEYEAADMQVSLDDYYGLVALQFSEGKEHSSADEPNTINVNGMRSLQTEATGKENTHDIYYKLAVVESESHFYQILVWTLLKQKEKYSNDLQKMIDSFHENGAA